jgi:hypothetical protein
MRYLPESRWAAITTAPPASTSRTRSWRGTAITRAGDLEQLLEGRYGIGNPPRPGVRGARATEAISTDTPR